MCWHAAAWLRMQHNTTRHTSHAITPPCLPPPTTSTLLPHYFHTTFILLPHTSQDVYSSEAVRGEVPADNLEATLARLNMDLPG